jgi:hypothetical protein
LSAKSSGETRNQYFSDGLFDYGYGIEMCDPERKKRLMCSGRISDENSNLLVKKEWDLAEAWLVEFPDTRTNEQNN